MKTTLKHEELALFILGIVAFSFIDIARWCFLLLILILAIGMLGYLFTIKIDASTYNLFHHGSIGISLFLARLYLDSFGMLLAGVFMFSHIAFDRMLGYRLKYPYNFKNTHLGII